MSYINAEKVLPQWLVDELRNYISDGLIYVPPAKPLRKEWGSKSGIKELLAERNNEIRYKKSNGMTISQLAVEYHLSEETIKRILYR